jgi:hypothetical protein
MCSIARHVLLRGGRVSAIGHSAHRHALHLQLDVGYGRLCDGLRVKGPHQQSAGVAEAAGLSRLRCVSRVLQQTLDELRVRSFAAATAPSSSFFLIMPRLLLPPVLKASPTFWSRRTMEMAIWCFAI